MSVVTSSSNPLHVTLRKPFIYFLSRTERLASIFLLSLTISVWLGSILPIYSQNPQKSDRETWENRIKGYAERHVENDQAPDTKSVVDLFKENNFNVTAPEIGEIYEKEYYRLKEIKDANIWENIKDNLLDGLPWGVAIILAILFLLKEKLTKWIDDISSKIENWFLNTISGIRFFWSFSLKRYRESLIKKYRQLKITFRPNRPLEMRDIYVPLKVSGKSENTQIDAFEAIEKYPRLMIKGSPGSGKSMLLKYLAFSWSEGRSTKISNTITPILLELNRLNELEEFTLEQFKNKLVESFKREDFPDANNFVSQALDNGNLMLLLDGLDEVNSNVRDNVIKLIKRILATYKQCPVIITCRSAVYKNEFVDFVKQTLEIVEFSDQQIRKFLKAWEKELEKKSKEQENELPQEKSINQLIFALRDRPQIIALARNPLLLTIIAYLYADTTFVLPHSRASFYEKAVTHLLELRDEERQIDNKFEAIHKRRVLQTLALSWADNASLQQQDRRNIEYEQVLEQIRSLLPALNLNSEQDAPAILAEIVERSGLLLPIDGGQHYQFSHLTLQEYFAAEALFNQESGLVRRFKQDTVTWRETVKLWCGLAGDKTSLIQQVYQHDALTGFECLADAKEVDQALADEIINYYKQQLSKSLDNDDLAKAFGSVAADLRLNSRGKLVFEFLEAAFNNNSDVLNQKASAKALSLTNLPQVSKILAEGYKRKKEYCEILLDDDQLDDHNNCLENIREALLRMGDLAVPQIVLLAELGNRELIQDLMKIATPDAFQALVDFLWHTNESLRFQVAWNLAELFTKDDFTETIQEFELTTEQKNTDYLDWIWQPFDDSITSQSLSIIAGRISYLLDKTPSESIPHPLPKLDPRLIVPLLSIHNVVNFQSSNISNPITDLFLLKQEQTSEIEQKIIEKVNQLLGNNFSQNRWRIILSSLQPRLQLDLIYRLIHQRRPNQNDWLNLYLKIDYQFQYSYHYRLALAFGLIASVVAIFEVLLLIYDHPYNSFIGFLILAIYLTLVFWISLWQGIEKRLEPNTFIQLGLFGILTFRNEIKRLLNDYIVYFGIVPIYKSVAFTAFVIFAFTGVAAFAFTSVAAFVTFANFVAFVNGASIGEIVAVAGSAVAGAAVEGVALEGAAIFEGIAVAAVVAVAGTVAGTVVGTGVAIIAGALIGMGLGFWYRAKSQKDWMRFLAIFAFPYFCWFPIVGVFSTLFMLRYLTWQYTALIWVIVLGICTALWLYGQNKERKASNPLTHKHFVAVQNTLLINQKIDTISNRYLL